MGDGPRYGFHPLERRGVLLGLGGGQIAALAGGLVAALAVRAAIGGGAGVAGGILALLLMAVITVWTREGQPVGVRLLLGGTWLRRRSGGPRLDQTPVVGLLGAPGRRSRPAPSGRVGRAGPFDPGPALTLAPPGIELVEDALLPGQPAMGVIRDRRSGMLAAALPVGGQSFSLLDGAEQAQALDRWRQVLGVTARPATPIVRLQWVQRTWTGGPLSHPADIFPEGGAPAAASSYRSLVGSALPDMTHHGVWVVLAVRDRGRARPDGIEVLRREMRFLEGQMRAAGLDPGPPLDAGALAATIRRSYEGPARLAAGPPGPAGIGAWPMAAQEGWADLRTDRLWHATYWVAEWPRVEVGPDFLGPLLVGRASRAVSVVMAPVPPERALREVRSARTADLADGALRARAGFLSSSRREKESEGNLRREEELADGHQEFRFSGYVTASGESPEGLAEACAELEHAAQSARLELRRLYGRQAEAFTWTLPLGRGLR